MLPFPDTFPIDAVKMIGDYVFKKNVQIADAACAAWNILGYAGSKIPSNEPTLWGDTMPSETEQQQYFESLTMSQGFFDNIPSWVFVLALNILKNYLERKVS